MAKKSKKKQDAKRQPKVTWASVVTPRDSGKTVDQLKAESEKAPPRPPEPTKRSVPRASLYLAESAFQWRGRSGSDKYERDKHIHTLAMALKAQKTPLARLTVWPLGDRFYVLDGHHRLGAYDTVGWSKAIPVDVYEGTLDEARLQAIRGNIKDKLRMTTQQKSEAAWTIVKENIGSLKPDQISEETTVSRRTVFNMKQAWEELNQRTDLSDTVKDKLPSITWNQARALKKGGYVDLAESWDADQWIDEKAGELTALIRNKGIERAFLKDPEITARAISRLNGELPQRLIEEWASDYREVIIDLAQIFTGPDQDF